MFASTFRSRSRAFILSVHSRPRLKLPFYSIYTFKALRGLPHDDLIDTLLTAKDKWLGEKEQMREKFFMAEKQFHATVKQFYATEKQFHETHILLKDQLLTSETKRNTASESQMQSEIELKLTKIRMRDLQIAILRNQNRFNLRGIIESIADQPDYDGTLQADEKLPSRKHGTQPRLDWIICFSPSYARFRQKILKHRGIRRTDFERSAKSLYHELSKHFHENRIPRPSNQDDIIVDMTKAYTTGVFSTLDGAVLESFLHYRHIPYTAITDSAVEQYAPAELGGDLERTVMPPGYRELLYRRVLNRRNFEAAEHDGEPTVSMSP